MEARIRSIFGDRTISNIEDFIMINRVPRICIYNDINNQPILAIYGMLLCSEPSDMVPIELDKLADTFSSKTDIINYIKTGTVDARLEKQMEIFRIAHIQHKFGNFIKKTTVGIDNKIKNGLKQVSVNCIPETLSVIKNYVNRNYAPKKISERGSSLDILI